MIILKNDGELDLNVITTMGVNIKTCEDPIGFFGTGLKYAIAVLLRENINFELFIGSAKYYFYAENKRIRNKEFKICKMVGVYDSIELGFTTDLGKNWELWQAYRELESNCRDEGGTVYEATGNPIGEKGVTKFVLHNLPPIGVVFLDKESKKELFKSKEIEIYEGSSNHIFYRGIRAKDLQKPSVYTYNILEESKLTEDRLLCYDWRIEEVINDAVAKMANKDIIKTVVTAPRGSFESELSMSYNTRVSPGDAFIRTVRSNARASNRTAIDYIKSHAPKKPLTLKEKAEQFKQSIEDLCKSYSLHYNIDKDGYVSIVACDLLKEDL